MDFYFRKPKAEDGIKIHDLVAQCPPLDTNSSYCNLLQASYFSGTAIVAERNGEICGCITGFINPKATDTLFVWQVAVSSSARGEGLASRMLADLVDRVEALGVHFLETTITQDNAASWALFERFARDRAAPLERSLCFEKDAHFEGRHATEFLARIGPFSASVKPQR
jgi:L-2,4-diaminobutyric acid acetyltransferase